MHLLTELVLIVSMATLVVAISQRLNLPSLLGFLFTGLVLGPVGLGLVSDSHAIELMAEIGVVLLMFTIGLEVSLKDLARLASRVLGAGSLQLAATTGLVAALFLAMGYNPTLAVVAGLLVAPSSTALVLRLLGERGELSTPYGQLSLAILLMQDFAVVGLMLLLPLAAGQSAGASAVLLSVGKAVGLAVGIFLAARILLPHVLRRLVGLRSREVFLLATLAAVFGTAWVSHAVGLSLALGAFIAGLVISESEFSHQMFAEVLPFRDVFNGLFFVSVGLLLERGLLLENPGLLLGMVVAALVLKALIVLPLGLMFKLPWRMALLTGIGLSQVGEFALVLAKQAVGLELISAKAHGLFVAMSVATMAISPLLLLALGPILKRGARAGDEELPALPDEHALEEHVIVVGYGLNGRNVTKALKQLGVRYIVVEMNRVTVLDAREQGVPIIYGDATRHALLHHLHIEKARALVCAIADAAATREIVSAAHHANDALMIIARTRFVSEIEPLHELGANAVVPEEFETSLELVARVLAAYGSSSYAIEREKSHLRRAQYKALLGERAAELDQSPSMAELLGSLAVEQLKVTLDHFAHQKSLAQLDLRQQTGATLIAILRQGQTISAPDAQLQLLSDDELVLVGAPGALARAQAWLTTGQEA